MSSIRKVPSEGEKERLPTGKPKKQEGIADARKYVVVKMGAGNIGYTTDAKLASTLDQIHQFIDVHRNELGKEEIELIKTLSPSLRL